MAQDSQQTVDISETQLKGGYITEAKVFARMPSA